MDDMFTEYDAEMKEAGAAFTAMASLSAQDYLASSGTWTATTADVTLPGPWQRSTCFWMDVRVGSCFRVDSETDNLTPEEMVRFEADILKADRSELANFVNHD
eukprot:4153828-Pyramimonas_sp.AAC.1